MGFFPAATLAAGAAKESARQGLRQEARQDLGSLLFPRAVDGSHAGHVGRVRLSAGQEMALRPAEGLGCPFGSGAEAAAFKAAKPANLPRKRIESVFPVRTRLAFVGLHEPPDSPGVRFRPILHYRALVTARRPGGLAWPSHEWGAEGALSRGRRAGHLTFQADILGTSLALRGRQAGASRVGRFAVRMRRGTLVFLLLLVAEASGKSPPGSPWQVLRVDSVEIRFTAADAANAKLVARHLTLDGLPISDELGLHRLPRATVFIAPDKIAFDTLSSAELPRWTAAVAIPARRRIVLKSPRWGRDSDLVWDLLHELTHILAAEATQGRPIPRWLDEGMALYFSRDLRYLKSRALSRALLTRSLVGLDEIDDVLRFHHAKAELAYQESLEAVRYMVDRFGSGVLQDLLMEIRAGSPFPTAFRRVCGVPYRLFEAELFHYWARRHRWDFLIDFVYVLWGGAVALAAIAYLLIRRRNRRLLRRWEEEEQMGGLDSWIGPPAPPDQSPDDAERSAYD
jgi:hypothetical protein